MGILTLINMFTIMNVVDTVRRGNHFLPKKMMYNKYISTQQTNFFNDILC
jgi:hypothetical protein